MRYQELLYREILSDSIVSEVALPPLHGSPEDDGRTKQFVADSIETGNLIQLRDFGFVRLADLDGVLFMDFWYGSEHPGSRRHSVKLGSTEGGILACKPDAVMRVTRPETTEDLPLLESMMAVETYHSWKQVEPSYGHRPTLEVLMRFQMTFAWTWLIEFENKQAVLPGLGGRTHNQPPTKNQKIEHIRQAAEQGNVHAQFTLGMMYEFGQGVPQDFCEAAKWYRRAAEQGDAEAQVSLGRMHQEWRGVPHQDYRKAVSWYQKAAEQGNARGQYHLAAAYAEGEAVPQDYREAVKWYRKAAEQGNIAAQRQLSHMYRYGRGVPKDRVTALSWLILAADRETDHGVKDATEAGIQSYELLMTPDQIRKARQLAADLLKRIEAGDGMQD